MSRAKRYTLVEAATILNCSVYDVKKAILNGKLRGEKIGIGRHAPWKVLLTQAQVEGHSIKPTVPERTVTHDKEKPEGKPEAQPKAEKKVAPDQAPDSESPSNSHRDKVSGRGYSPVDWLG